MEKKSLKIFDCLSEKSNYWLFLNPTVFCNDSLDIIKPFYIHRLLFNEFEIFIIVKTISLSYGALWYFYSQFNPYSLSEKQFPLSFGYAKVFKFETNYKISSYESDIVEIEIREALSLISGTCKIYRRGMTKEMEIIITTLNGLLDFFTEENKFYLQDIFYDIESDTLHLNFSFIHSIRGYFNNYPVVIPRTFSRVMNHLKTREFFVPIPVREFFLSENLTDLLLTFSRHVRDDDFDYFFRNIDCLVNSQKKSRIKKEAKDQRKKIIKFPFYKVTKTNNCRSTYAKKSL